MAARRGLRQNFSLLRSIKRLPAYLRDPQVAVWKKIALALAMVYLISPVDAVPDWIPLLGWLDDLGVVGLVIGWLTGELRDYQPRRRHDQAD